VVEAVMTNSTSSIAAERKGHRRGLVLGFTMAETFLLLVFCLLLVTADCDFNRAQLRKQAVSERYSAVAELNIANQRTKDLADQNKLLSEENEKLERRLRTRLRSARIGAN
jgi:cell division protein FtsB